MTVVRCAAAWWVLLSGVCGGTAHAADAGTPAVRATLYAFFATWCVPCRGELPHVEALHRTHASRGLRVVVVSEDDESARAEVPGLLGRLGVTAPWVADADSELLSRFHPTASVPFVVLLDAAGAVAYAHSGYEPGDEHALAAAVERLLAGAEESAAPDAGERRGFTQSFVLQSIGVWRARSFQSNTEAALQRVSGVMGRLEGTARYDRYALSARADAMMLHNTWQLRRPIEARRLTYRDLRLERITAEADFDLVRLRAGDTYVSVGRGVLLSLRKDDVFANDTSLRGGRVDVDWGPVRATVAGGLVNPQNLEPRDFRLDDERDLDDRVVAAEMAWRFGEVARVGPQLLWAHVPRGGAEARGSRWLLGGAAASLELAGVRAAVDVAAGERRDGSVAGTRRRTPRAVYASLAWDLGPTTTLVEGKYYRHWDLGHPREEPPLVYHGAPTLEREDQEVPENRDSAGGRLRVDWRVTGWASVFGNVLYYGYTEDGSAPLAGGGDDKFGGTALHALGGLELRFGDRANMQWQAGHRREVYRDGVEKLRLTHLDLDGAVAIARGWSATWEWLHVQERKRLALSTLDFARGLLVAGIGRTGLGTLSVLYGYSNASSRVPTHYPGAELRLVMDGGSELRLFGGRLAGGLVCSGGVCRRVEAFEGVRLDWTLRL